MIYPFLFDDRQEGLVQLGIYSATSKVAMVMAMFTQAFRYAYEPFVFGKNKEGDNREMYAKAMKYFFIFSLLAFLAVMFYMDILRYLIAPDYWEGLGVVAIVMGAEILKGIYFNLSFWYKLTDETKWGAYFSIIGCAVILILNIWLVPQYGYVASAWASVAGYGLIGFGSRIRAYHPAFLCDRTEEIPRSLSVERHDGLPGFCRCVVYPFRRNKHRERLRTVGFQYVVNRMLCWIYLEERPSEGDQKE